MSAKNYDDIINLPHYEPKNHPRLTSDQRAAQFAPFAALTGYEDAVVEMGRITNTKIELDETQKGALDQKLRFMKEHLSNGYIYTIMYFEKDHLKDGGEYKQVVDSIKKVNDYEAKIIMNDGIIIAIEDIYSITCEEFPDDLN